MDTTTFYVSNLKCMNNCAFIGRFVADPVLTKLSNGVEVCNFVIAVPRPWNFKKTDFFKCVVWRKNAAFIKKYFHKGDQIGLNGYMTTEFYEKDGVKQVACRYVVSDIHPIWQKKNIVEQAKENKENPEELNSEDTLTENDNANTDNIVNSDDLSVILGNIPEYDIFENPESIDYAYFDELYNGVYNP